ncbi:ribosomal large subunit pseudouridine synthase B [mine drainage metagenome]|uniref:Ribosomal large subunit pseudouridine synthase B n=1 Tax=mine drainage metagenome TaxID=410659 RepID=A0A1J5SAA5_9ZZZZ
MSDATDATDTPAADTPEKGERIAKRLARAGLCSRRDAERWIAEGRVVVDGRRLASPAVTVTEASLIVVDGKPLPASEPTRLWRYHKPAGLVTSHKDEQGRDTVFQRLPEGMPRVISVGRLDLNSEGLLLLTNDGDLARRLELPTTGWVRRYRVRVHGEPTPETLAGLEKGLDIDGVAYGPIKAVLDRKQGSNAWLTVSLKEGKNREIRRVMEYLGWTVTRLIRIAYGPFQLGLLNPGEVDEVPPRVLREQLGTAGAKLAPKAPKDKDRTRDAAAPARKGAATPSARAEAKKAEASLAAARPGNRARHARKSGAPDSGGKSHADRRRPS